MTNLHLPKGDTDVKMEKTENEGKGNTLQDTIKHMSEIGFFLEKMKQAFV